MSVCVYCVQIIPTIVILAKPFQVLSIRWAPFQALCVSQHISSSWSYKEGISTPPVLLTRELKHRALKSEVTHLTCGMWQFRPRQPDWSPCALPEAWLLNKAEVWEPVGPPTPPYSGPSILLPRTLPCGLFMHHIWEQSRNRGLCRVHYGHSAAKSSASHQAFISTDLIHTPAPTLIAYVIWQKMLNEALWSLIPLPRIVFPRICMWLLSSFTVISSQHRCHLLSRVSLTHLIWNKHPCPGQCGSVDWASSLKPKGSRFYSCSGYMPRSHVGSSPVGERARGNRSIFPSHINVSLPFFPLSLESIKAKNNNELN